MVNKVIKTTSKGQITIPMKWRKKFNTDNFMLEVHKDKLVIKPIDITQEEVLFDADKDNDGKGISPDEMIKALKEIQSGQN